MEHAKRYFHFYSMNNIFSGHMLITLNQVSIKKYKYIFSITQACLILFSYLYLQWKEIVRLTLYQCFKRMPWKSTYIYSLSYLPMS